MSKGQPDDSVVKRFFHSEHEELVAILGRGYLESLLSGYGASKGVLILSDQRLYQKGQRYSNVQGRGWSTMAASSVVNVEDITGTSFLSYENSGLLWTGLILGLLSLVGLVMGEVAFMIGGAVLGVFSISCFVGYGRSRVRLFTVEYAGGTIAMAANWFSQAELNNFQRAVSMLKTQGRATSAAQDQMTAHQHGGQRHPIQILKMRLAEGEITKEEYQRMKSILAEDA